MSLGSFVLTVRPRTYINCCMEIRTIELRNLRYFIAVAQELHFGRAAARLHTSQPPLTERIKRLEEELGVMLFERTKRSVRITAAGSALFLEAQRILGDVEGLYQVVRRANEGMT